MKKKIFYAFLSTACLLFPVLASASSSNYSTQPQPLAKTFFHVKGNATSTYQSGMSTSQVRRAYGFDQLSQTGAGKTIAIIDAYGSPTIQNDLQVFSNTMKLTYTAPSGSNLLGDQTSTLEIHPMASKIKTNGGWALETSLDVEWAHSIAPNANILLVESPSATTTDLMAAIKYAASRSDVVAISNSWGGSEFSSETTFDASFQTYGKGKVIVASSGDNGSGVIWPAASPYVLSVGGTTLYLQDSAGDWGSETAWSGSGGGMSKYENRPGYQDAVQNVVGPSRGTPDISMDADPNTGVAVYDSTLYQGQKGWWQVGGTSLSAPLWSGLVTLTDETRTTPLDSYDAITQLYNFYNSQYTADYHDITSGSNGYNAALGYDLVTGIGSPQAVNLVPVLASAP